MLRRSDVSYNSIHVKLFIIKTFQSSFDFNYEHVRQRTWNVLHRFQLKLSVAIVRYFMNRSRNGSQKYVIGIQFF
jgi:hypothetical protein